MRDICSVSSVIANLQSAGVQILIVAADVSVQADAKHLFTTNLHLWNHLYILQIIIRPLLSTCSFTFIWFGLKQFIYLQIDLDLLLDEKFLFKVIIQIIIISRIFDLYKLMRARLTRDSFKINYRNQFSAI